jgi:hypothetical protein
MSWFNTPYSKKTIDKEQKTFIRKYGKVKRFSEIKDFDSLPIDDATADHEDESTDDNKDEKFDYSDLED